MKNLLLLLILFISFPCLSQDDSKELDSKLIGKWEYNKVEITFRSDRDREKWNKPFYIVFAKDGSLLVVMDNVKKADKWSTKRIDELKLEDAESMNYSLINDDILILGIENTIISMHRVKCNWKKEQVLLDSALVEYEERKLSKLNNSMRESEEIDYYDYYETDEEDEPEEVNEVFEIFDVSEMAQFRSGHEDLVSFIDSSLVYPKMAKNNEISGTVNLMFIIDVSGNIIDVQTLGSKKGYGLEEEAIRIIKSSSGQWKPAKQRDKPVKMRYRMPVEFKLDK